MFYHPQIDASIMEYGIPDEAKAHKSESENEKIVMAVIGAIYEIKGQKILLDAIGLLDDDIKDKCEFWIIGKSGDENYYKDVVLRAAKMKSVKLMGEVTHDELLGLYKKIDVVISSSTEDMLPIVIVEGMMFGKKCIIPENIGLSEYVSDGKEVLKYETGNKEDLSAKIARLVTDFDSLSTMNGYAREFYEREFSMDAFSNRITQALRIL